MVDAAKGLRIDKWLWYARFFKTRGLATDVVKQGKVRVDGVPVSKPAREVKPGMVLTFAQGDNVRVIKIVELGTRRGPAPEAQALYKDQDPPKPKEKANTVAPNPRYEGKGRPTKKDRRNLGPKSFFDA